MFSLTWNVLCPHDRPEGRLNWRPGSDQSEWTTGIKEARPCWPRPEGQTVCAQSSGLEPPRTEPPRLSWAFTPHRAPLLALPGSTCSGDPFWRQGAGWSQRIGFGPDHWAMPLPAAADKGSIFQRLCHPAQLCRSLHILRGKFFPPPSAVQFETALVQVTNDPPLPLSPRLPNP